MYNLSGKISDFQSLMASSSLVMYRKVNLPCEKSCNVYNLMVE